MVRVLRLRRIGIRTRRGFDPLGALMRLDAAYRERRRIEELTPEQLRDVGLTRADVERMLGRG